MIGSVIGCGHNKASCIDTRQMDGYRRRRYQCKSCGLRWTTVEIAVELKKQGIYPVYEAIKEKIGLSDSSLVSLVEKFICEYQGEKDRKKELLKPNGKEKQ